jgi:hypothetical protein
MNKYAFPAAIVASFIATSAIAQPMSQVCNILPCIYDHNSKLVGIPVAIGNAIRQVNSKWYMVNLTKSGIEISDNFFYFSDSDCSGKGPYLYDPGWLPHPTSYDGNSLFAAANTTKGFDWRSYWSPDNGGSCTNQSCGTANGACHSELGGPAVVVETVTFSAPLQMR